MPNRVTVPLTLRPAGVKRAKTSVKWATLTDGGQWELKRGTDWTAKTAQQVVDSAKNYAAKNGLALSYEKDADTVWVQFQRIAPPATGTEPTFGPRQVPGMAL